MEQSKYWLQTRSRLIERSVLGHRMLHAITAPGSLYYAESWEERAFAKDSSGLLGGCTWPPRSYTCSFCRREFRSAQALGGHMNVHRRDRARLKQSSSCGSEGTATDDHDHHQNPCKGMNASDIHQISLALDAEHTSNPINYTALAISSLSSNTLASPSFSSSETQEKHVESNCEAPRDINPRHELIKHGENLTMKDADSDMPRNLCGDDEAIVSIKRQRIGGTFPFMAADAATSSIQLERSTEVLTLIPSAVEELDLELRLGCSSKHKAVVCLSN